MTVLIDTNVVLDYILKRDPFAENARQCIEGLISNNSKIFLTASTVTDIYYIVRRQLSDNVLAKDVVSKLLVAFNLAAVDKNDCLNALATDISDYEDALVSVCAKKVKATYILARNAKHFQNSYVKPILPDELLKQL